MHPFQLDRQISQDKGQPYCLTCGKLEANILNTWYQAGRFCSGQARQRHVLLLLIIIPLSSLASTAVAQVAAPPDTEAPSDPPHAQDASSNQLEDIVVTAQRRSERLQDVPVAVVALTATSLKQMGISGTDELSQAVPGLEFSSRQANGATIYVRGVGNPNGATGQESSVALYVDGVYYPSPVVAMFSFNKIDG